MKKLLLSLGTVAAIAAPVASVIACGKSPKETAQLEAAKKALISSLDDFKTLSATDKATDIIKINAAKDIAALKIVVSGLNLSKTTNTGPGTGNTQVPTQAPSQHVQVGNTGTAKNTGAPTTIISILNGNTKIKALGAKDATYKNTIDMTAGKNWTGVLTLTFTATKAGTLDGVSIAANSVVTIILDSKNQDPNSGRNSFIKINGTLVVIDEPDSNLAGHTSDSHQDQVMPVIAALIQL